MQDDGKFNSPAFVSEYEHVQWDQDGKLVLFSTSMGWLPQSLHEWAWRHLVAGWAAACCLLPAMPAESLLTVDFNNGLRTLAADHLVHWSSTLLLTTQVCVRYRIPGAMQWGFMGLFTSDTSHAQFLTFQRRFWGPTCWVLVIDAPVENTGKLFNFPQPQFLFISSAKDNS